MKKNILIYINDSLGELDWIAPFMNSEYGNSFNFFIFLNGPGNSFIEKQKIIDNYNLLGNNIHILNQESKLEIIAFCLDDFLNKILGRVKIISYDLFKAFRYFFNTLRYICSFFISNNSTNFDFIFRDYNLKDSIYLNYHLRKNKNAKIIIFPHAIGFQIENYLCPREPIRVIFADLWLDNSRYSNIKNNKNYSNIFLASGPPSFDSENELPSLFDKNSKRVMIITRDCGSIFGFNYKDSLNELKHILSKLNNSGYQVFIKHHPRDKRLDAWRLLQKKYSNVIEIYDSLNNLDNKYCLCITLFSTAPFFLLNRKIPILEFSPYGAYEHKMPFHYPNKNKEVTHDFIEMGMYKKLKHIKELDKNLKIKNLENLSKYQYKKFKKIFELDANKKIFNKLKNM
jgi:hypothetical protein